MTWHVIHLADVPVVPWRNGGGLTRELATSPATDHWLWRMSVAEVAAHGAFSRFEGVTRWLAVLQGAGVVLHVRTPCDTGEPDACEHRLTPLDAPLCFDGAAATDCHLIGDPTLDFNLMVRPQCLPARMVRLHGDYQAAVAAMKTVAVFAVGSGATVRLNAQETYLPADTLIWRTLTKSATVHIHAEHALWMELSDGAEVHP